MTTAEHVSADAAQLAEFTRRLFVAVRASTPDLVVIDALLAEGGRVEYPWLQDSERGWTAMHFAASAGQADVVRRLLAVGHPWNALDDAGNAPAQVALQNGHAGIYQLLVEEACRSELLLNAIAKDQRNDDDKQAAPVDATTTTTTCVESCGTTTASTAAAGSLYLKGDAVYSADGAALVDSQQNAVMMEWERGLMLQHALAVCQLDEAAAGTDAPLVESYMAALPRYTGQGIPHRHTVLADCRRVYREVCQQLDCSSTAASSSSSPTSSTSTVYSVLNVGFGLGLVDTFIAQLLALRWLHYGQRTHHAIIEAHPAVLNQMASRGWLSTRATDQQDKSVENSNQTEDNSSMNLVVHPGRWQDVLQQAEMEYETADNSGCQLYAHGLFHGIFFDTFGEDYHALQAWHEHVVNMLDCHSAAVYSFFNGLAGTNAYFHDVYNRVVEMDLCELGLTVEWRQCKVDSQVAQWDGLQRNYYTLPLYDLPVCRPLQY